MRAVFAAALLLATTQAEAGVIYRWQSITPDSIFGPLEATIEFPDAAFAAGHVSGFKDSNVDAPADSEPFTSFVSNLVFWPNGRDLLAGTFYAIDLDLGQVLTGVFEIVGPQEDFFMASDATGLWTFSHIGSDLTQLACSGDECTGSGRWVLRVAEPPVAAILGLGLMTLVAIERRKERTPAAV